ncbi:sugar ABC transporter substrate-binding protein [Nakamurella antarctica]|uniref:Sugar ABC transporter substrate-binding protein n=1 Tax=Nakamurella antarctica TaxID=1902245 RepID=A0A3G8ZHV1_9ACTN|nr:sugar ABC transporter substrate-binding protein [Nakamurella antarctica]AZI56853.1 sugar ABC transporter substrate-binding protein [Nakamurella antarctica]
MSQASAEATVVLKGMTWDHPRGVDGLLAAAPLVLERHGVTLEWEARSLLAFGDQHIADFARDFDVMVIDHPHIADAVEAGALLCLDATPGIDDLARESVGFSHESYRYRGAQWGLALDAAAQVSAFRPDRADGAPLLWSDTLTLARTGTVVWPYKPVDAFSSFATLLAQRGAPLAASLVGPGLFLDRGIAGEVLEFMIELSGAVPDWCATANPIDAAEALVAENNDYSVGVALFGYTNYSRPGFRQHVLAYDDIPSFDGQSSGSTLGGAGIAVSASTQHADLALAVAATLAGAEVQSGPYTAGGGQPGNLRAWRSAATNQATQQFFRNTLRTLERAWVRPRVPGWPDLQLALSHLVRDAIIACRVDDTLLDAIERLPELHLTTGKGDTNA